MWQNSSRFEGGATVDLDGQLHCIRSAQRACSLNSKRVGNLADPFDLMHWVCLS